MHTNVFIRHTRSSLDSRYQFRRTHGCHRETKEYRFIYSRILFSTKLLFCHAQTPKELQGKYHYSPSASIISSLILDFYLNNIAFLNDIIFADGMDESFGAGMTPTFGFEQFLPIDDICTNK